MRKLVIQILTGILGLWLATKFIEGVELKAGNLKILFLAGLILGLINFFIKPILKIITLPLRILTFGLFGLIINMGIIWAVSKIFPELVFHGLLSLFLTTIIVWFLSLIIPIFIPKN
jgi:putative membrane protein